MRIDFIAAVEKSAGSNMLGKTVDKTPHHVSDEYARDFRKQLDRVMRKDDDRRSASTAEQKRTESEKTSTSNEVGVVSSIRKNEESEVSTGEWRESIPVATVPEDDAPEMSAAISPMFSTETVVSIADADVVKNPHDGVATDSKTEVSGIVPEETGVFSSTNGFADTTENVALSKSSTIPASGDSAISSGLSSSGSSAFQLSETVDESGMFANSDGKASTTLPIDSSARRLVSSATDIPMDVDEDSFNTSDPMREAAVLTTKAQETGKSQLPSFTADGGRAKTDDVLQLTGKAVAKEIASPNSEAASRAGTQSENAGRGTGQSSSDGDTPALEWLAEHIRHAGNSAGRENQNTGPAKEIASPAGMNIRSVASTTTTEIAMTSAVNTSGREFVAQVADHIHIHLRNGGGEIRIQLHPKELGHMDIRAEQGRDGLMARITVESREVKNLLESNLASLRHVLEERGLRVDRINIVTQDDADTSVLADGGNRSGQTFAGQRHRNASGFDEDGENPDDGIEISTEETDDELAGRMHPDSRFYTVA